MTPAALAVCVEDLLTATRSTLPRLTDLAHQARSHPDVVLHSSVRKGIRFAETALAALAACDDYLHTSPATEAETSRIVSALLEALDALRPLASRDELQQSTVCR